jgi:CRISPR/Cas system CSM-associated protein Csm2 small subunit
MPYNLRTKLKHLAYERDITVKECEKLIKALDALDGLEKLESEIEDETYKYFEPFNDYYEGIRYGLTLAYQKVVDKCLKKEQDKNV